MVKFKELKKTIAGVLAMAMMFTPAVVSADANISTSGGTESYVVKEAYDVRLPAVSSNDLAFKLDPQGLLKVSQNTNTGFEMFTDDTVSAGDIVFYNKASVNGVSGNAAYGKFNKSNVIYATNMGSEDVTFMIDIAMTNSSDVSVNFVSSDGIVDEPYHVSNNEVDDAKLNVYMAAVPEVSDISWNKVSLNQAISSNSGTDVIALAKTDDGDASAKVAFKISGNPTNYDTFRTGVSSNGKGIYKFDKIDVSANGWTPWQTVGFTLTGKCNSQGYWKKFDDKNATLGLTLTWTLNKATGNEVPTGSAFGLIKADSIDGIKIKRDGTPIATPAPTGIAYASQNPTTKDVTLTFTPGTAAKTLATDYLAINGVAISSWSSFASKASFSGNTITILGSTFSGSSIQNATTGNSYVFTVKDTDGTSYTSPAQVITF